MGIRVSFEKPRQTRYALFARWNTCLYGLKPIRSTITNECGTDMGMRALVSGVSAKDTLWNSTFSGYLLKMHYGIAPFDEREEPEA